MKKILVSLLALSVVGLGSVANAGTIGDALQNAANNVNKHEQAVTQAQKDAQARQAANRKAWEKKQQELKKKHEQAKKDVEKAQKERQQALEKKKQELKKRHEQAQKDARARQAANQKALQKKKDAWNTLIGK